MKKDTDLKAQLGAALCGPVFVIGYLIFWGLLGHFVPPPSVTLSASDLMNVYYSKFDADILLGMSVSAVIGIVYMPWTAQISAMMRNPEHDSPTLANIQLLGGGITAWLLAACPAMWAHAAKIAPTDPVMAQAIYQDAWYIYDLTYLITTTQMVSIGVYALTDPRVKPLFPKWAAVLSIGSGLSFLGLTIIPYVTSGPFTIGGWWNFYIVFGSWLLWFSSLSYYMITNITRRMRGAVAVANAPLQARQAV